MIGPRKVDKPLVLYGMGKLGKLAHEIFTEIGVDVFTGIDRDMPFDFSRSAREKALIAVCIASEPYEPIADHLRSVGWTDIVPVWDIIEAYPECGIRNGWFVGELTPEDIQGINYVMRHFKDLLCRMSYSAFISWREYRDDYPYIPVKPIPALPSTLADIRARQRVGTWDTWQWGDGPTTVTIHAEGLELETIEKNLSDFIRYRPKISVACYHSRDGLWKIPKLLMDNLKDYRFKFRLHAYQGQAAFLYAEPKGGMKMDED